MNGIRKCTLLYQHLTGEAKRSISGLACNWKGYIVALKRLKYLFGDVSIAAASVIRKISQGGVIRQDNKAQLTQFLYDISDAIVALEQLGNSVDLYSNEVLNLTVRRLCRPLKLKWCEYSLRLKIKGIKPNLMTFE